jgi:predicted aspartyl protease
VRRSGGKARTHPLATPLKTVFQGIFVFAIVTGCSAPRPSVKDTYIANRLAVVDPTQPCELSPKPVIPIRVVNRQVYLPVVVNGIETIGVLDTGADESLVTPEIAAAAKLPLSKSKEQFRGVAGAFATVPALVEKFQVGPIIYTGKRIVQVFPFADSRGTDIGAQIGMDWLDGFDYDIDFRNQLLRPYETNNCVIIDPPWPNTSTGLELRRGPLDLQAHSYDNLVDSISEFREISLPVTFPGGFVDALFDTGSSDSMLSHAAARDAGVSVAALDADPVQTITGIDGAKTKAHLHRFDDIAIGEEELHNVTMAVAMHFDRRDTSMILGMDYIGTHHIWLSLTTNSIYIDSGEKRKLTPPMENAHTVGGATMPGFPVDATAKSGTVTAGCWVEGDGSLTGCQVTQDANDKAFGRAVLFWLTGAAHPVMQPAYRNGHPMRQWHLWMINFVPSEKK